jgi:glycosyltransferase involved in cell wall biosynthesis
MKVHIISFTPLDAPGGVPRFNRYLKQVLEEDGHEVYHWSWFNMWAGDPGSAGLPEHLRAVQLSRWLHSTGKVGREDVIIGDGFWCGDFVKMGYRRVISVAHGIWGHVTLDDLKNGAVPENRELHEAQVRHRIEHQRAGLPVIAVSAFISEQMYLQDGIESVVINNAVESLDQDSSDDDWWTQFESHRAVRPTLVVHGVNDPGNTNKGWDHIIAVSEAIEKEGFPQRIIFGSLDEIAEKLRFKKKMNVLRAADLAVIPSGYEGNSYWALELLKSGVPVVAYNVGLFHEIYWSESSCDLTVDDDYRELSRIGIIGRRSKRSPELTATMAIAALRSGLLSNVPSSVTENYASFESFRRGWQEAVRSICP